MGADLKMVKLLIVIRMIKNYEYMLELITENEGGQKDFSSDEVGLSRLILFDTQFQQRGDFILNSDDYHTCYDQIQNTDISMPCQ